MIWNFTGVTWKACILYVVIVVYVKCVVVSIETSSLKILYTSWSLWCQHAWVCNPAISRNRNDEEKYFIFFFIIPTLRVNIQPSSHSLWLYDMKYHGGHMKSFYYICCYRGLCEMRGGFYWDFLLKNNMYIMKLMMPTCLSL